MKESTPLGSEVALREADRPNPEIFKQAQSRVAEYFTACRRRVWRGYLTAYALNAPV
ncbi:MAG: hypothetical protein IH953_04795 [Chloroflexi bacterium]|nr:hypothetical protein [Chloroflexota bacterium]